MTTLDQFGQRVSVGDQVLYVHSGRSASFILGTVTKVHPKGGVDLEMNIKNGWRDTSFNVKRFVKFGDPE
jgi:hypothetical protein